MDLSFVTRKFQRSIAGLSLLAILASFAGFTGTAFASTFSDVSSSYFAYDQIDSLSDDGIMTGYENGNFGPNDTLTREQAAKILVEAFVGSTDSSYDAGFSDVADGMWYTDYVNTGALYGIFSGHPDGSFGVGENINRADFAKMVVSAAGLDSDGTMGSDMFNDVTDGAYYDTYVGTAWAYSVVDGTSSSAYSPASSVTRGQAAKMTYNAMNPVYRGDTGDTGSADATVTVEVSSDTPAAATIPSNATSVELASFDFTAEGDDSVLDGLTVHQYGISSATQMTVYLYNGAQRLTSGTTVNSTTHESQFRNLNLALSEGDTTTLTVRSDMGDWTATGEVGFEVASADAVDVGDSTVEGDFPAMGEKFSISTTDVGSITIAKNGNVNNAQVGEDDAYVAKFTLTAGSAEGGYVQELGVYTAGTISTMDVENFRLYVSGNDSEPVAQVDNVDDLDVVRFVAGEGEGVMDGVSDGYYLEKGQSKNFYVLADFNTGRTGDTVGMYVDQDTDVRVEGDLYGFGLSVTRTAYDGNANSCAAASDADCTFQTLTGGDITVSSSGPAATDVAINGKDVSLLNFTVATVTDVTFDTFPIALTGSESADTTEGLLNATAANFTDIKIVDTDSGDQIYSSIDADVLITTNATTGTAITEAAGDNAIAYHDWTDDWIIDAGSEYNLALETDIANTSTLDSMTIIGTLPFTAAIPVMKDVNNKTLTNSSVLVPNSSIAGKTMTVRAPSLTLSLASTPAAGANSYVKGARDVPFTGIVFACGQASDCRVTDVTLQGYLDDNGSGTPTFTTATDTHTSSLSSYVGAVALLDSDGNTIAASESVNTTTFVVTYTNMDWSIDAGDTEIVYVTGDISSNAFANTDAEDIAFGISSTANVTVEDGDGNTFTPTNTVNTGATTYVATTNGGTLTVAVAAPSDTPHENIAVAGTSGMQVSKFKLTSTREAFTVDKLSLNNRQSAVTTANLGDYDNNVSSVSISYTNSDGDTETSTGYLVSGTAQFSGLDLYVPSDSSTYVTASVTLNPFSSSGSTATAAEFVDLAMAFDTFNAVSSSSGSTYTAANLDAGTANLSIGTITWTDGDAATDVAITAGNATLGGTFALEVDDDDDATKSEDQYPVGTLLCVDEGEGGTCATEDIVVVTAVSVCTAAATPSASCADALEDVYTVKFIDDAGAAAVTDEALLYSLPGSGYFTGTNQMVVYESKPTLALSSGSPSGSRSVSASDDAFDFTVTTTSNSGDRQIVINPSVDFATCLAGTGATLTSAAQTTSTVDGSSCEVTAVDTNTDSMLYANTADLTPATYGYISFWFRWHDDSASGALPLAAIRPFTADANDGTEDNLATALAATNIAGAPTVFDEDTWYLVKDVAMPTGTDTGDVFIGLQFPDATNILDDVADDVFVDQFRVYNQKIEIDITSDGDLDRTYNQGSSCSTAGNTGCPVVATLKNGSTTLATGYVDSAAVDATSDGAEDATDGSLGVIQFIPTSTQGEIDITTSASKTLSVVLDTTKLLADDAGSDDPITFSIDLGSSASGTVTAGDFWWSDTNANVRWTGDVTSSTLVSNTVNY